MAGPSELSEGQLEELYQWVDSVPLSRRKKNLPRDFSDGVLFAETIHHFLPHAVDLHNYDQGLRIDTKVYNWKTLNRKVLQQFGMNLDTETMTSLAQARPGCIEKILWDLKQTLSGRLRQKDGTYFDDYTEIPDIAALEAAQSASDQKLLDQKIQESEEQAEYISALEAKIVKLEELMRLKDAKIAKLTASSKKPKR